MAAMCRSLAVLPIVLMFGFTLGTTSCGVEDNVCLRDKLLVVNFPPFYNMTCNEKLTQSITENEPQVEIYGGDQGQSYLLLIVDPDYNCSINHIGIGELHFDHLESETDILPYLSPAPRSCHGYHRYQYFAYMWSRGDNSVTLNPPFNLPGFESDNGLEKPFAVFQIKVKAD